MEQPAAVGSAQGAPDPDPGEALVRTGRMAALGELASGAAHEINNPLFAILTLVGFLLREAESGSKAHERLLLIEGSAKDIQAVVERVHRFARDRGGDHAATPLQEAAHAALELVRYTSASRTIEIRERYPAEPAQVAGDAARLKSLFVQLFVNSVQAMPDGGVLTVEVEREEGDVVARVRDDGPGIPADTAERIFDLFHTTKAAVGTGVGLTAARAIAEAHGGSLAVDPAAERGACLVLRLPEAAE